MTVDIEKGSTGSLRSSPSAASCKDHNHWQGALDNAEMEIPTRKRGWGSSFPVVEVNVTCRELTSYPRLVVEDNEDFCRPVTKRARCSIPPKTALLVSSGGRYEAPLKSPRLQGMWSRHHIRAPLCIDLDSTYKRRPAIIRAVHFAETVLIQDIPPASAYTQEERERLWTTLADLQRDAKRNATELWFDGGDWRHATEEDQFCVWEAKNGETQLIHPYTYEVYTRQEREAEQYGSISKVSSCRDLSKMSNLIC